jgi:hypothetical protein
MPRGASKAPQTARLPTTLMGRDAARAELPEGYGDPMMANAHMQRLFVHTAPPQQSPSTLQAFPLGAHPHILSVRHKALQQSVLTAQALPSGIHGAVQTLFVHTRPLQQSKSPAQVLPVGPHPHTPPAPHKPPQHSLLVMQVVPSGRHGGVQDMFVHTRPLQQSVLTAHELPCPPHMAPHTPLAPHKPPQHSPLTVQEPPSITHCVVVVAVLVVVVVVEGTPHFPPVHKAPTQQSVSTLQALPFGRHVHFPPMHESSQQSVLTVQALPFGTHVSVVVVVVLVVVVVVEGTGAQMSFEPLGCTIRVPNWSVTLMGWVLLGHLIW